MEMALRYFLPIFFAIYVITAFLWPLYLTWKRSGINAYVFGQSDTAHNFVGFVFRLLIGSCALVIAFYDSWPDGYRYLTPIPWLQHPALSLAGLGLLSASLLWTIVAQVQMGLSWRIGIDALHKTALIQTGVFHWSRNPIFLGVRLTLLGFFLALPNAVTLAILVVGEATMQIQVRLEEEFLAQEHGAAYENYRRQTRRWL